MSRYLILPILLLLTGSVMAQQHRVKAGAIVLPIGGSEYGMINFSYERLNKRETASWQFTIHYAGSHPAADVRTKSRKWITTERIYYAGKDAKVKFFGSIFLEAGDRKELPGDEVAKLDSVFQKQTSFELNPGAAIGLHFIIAKKLGFQMVTGPKLIFANKKDHYYNSLTNTFYSAKYQEAKAGYRVMLSLSYQF